MNVKVVETLGDIVAFKTNEVWVLKSVYDEVPAISQSDFETVVLMAKEAYDAEVKLQKSQGNKPNAAQIKKSAITEYVKPFLAKHGVGENVHKQVYKSDKPRIPSDNEKITVSSKNILATEDVSLEEIGMLFENFDSESLASEAKEEPASQGVVVFDDNEGLFDDEDFDFESLLD